MTFCADDEPETWKPIEGFPGYEVSDQGRVRSYFAHRKGHWTILEQPRRLLRPGHTSGGHLCVILRKDQRDHSRSVSRLVAQAFIGPPPAGAIVLHLDGDVENDRAENLAYGSPGDVYSYRTPGAKLTPAQVLEIRGRRADGRSPFYCRCLWHQPNHAQQALPWRQLEIRGWPDSHSERASQRR